jgi:hypothetical protein
MPSTTTLFVLAAVAGVGYTLYINSNRLSSVVIDKPIAEPKPVQTAINPGYVSPITIKLPGIMNHHLTLPIEVPHFRMPFGIMLPSSIAPRF